MSVMLNAEARARLDKHLDAVEAALTAVGNTREQRRGVMDDLEAQIAEMLTARSQSPTAADVEEVLQQLDPPAAYAGTASAPLSAPPAVIKAVVPCEDRAPIAPRFSRTAIVGLVFILLGLLPPLRIFHDPNDISSAVFALVGTVLGWIAVYQIRGAGGALRGTGLAVFDGLFYLILIPVVILGGFASFLFSRP